MFFAQISDAVVCPGMSKVISATEQGRLFIFEAVVDLMLDQDQIADEQVETKNIVIVAHEVSFQTNLKINQPQIKTSQTWANQGRVLLMVGRSIEFMPISLTSIFAFLGLKLNFEFNKLGRFQCFVWSNDPTCCI